MKSLILFAMTLSQFALAIPVLNQNAAGNSRIIVIWPDSVDADLFYFAPSAVRISKTNEGTAKFSLVQYRTNCTRFTNNCQSKALLTTLFVANYLDEEIKLAQDAIRRHRPQARFSTIPFTSGKLDFIETAAVFIDKHDCDPLSGQAIDEIPCSLTLNRKGMTVLMPRFARGETLPLKFNYTIEGVLARPDNKFETAKIKYGVAVYLGGEELADHPDLVQRFIWQ